MVISGEKLAVGRMKTGFSIKDLSALSGINSATIHRIEQGKCNPRPKTAKALCDALGLPFDDLFHIVDGAKAG